MQKEISYQELHKLYENEDFIPYAALLSTREWQAKRLEILERDNYRCQLCKGFETSYRNDKLEWYNVSFIFWTDLDKKERVSQPIMPTYTPDKPYNLQIHHKKYILNRLPWIYDNIDLQTLCNYCHAETHDNEIIPIYDESGHKLTDYSVCDRCHGTGIIPEFKHVQHGVCFKCNGDRFNVKLVNKKTI
jgi:hypothetical protein